MGFDEFTKAVLEKTQTELGTKYHVSIKYVTKNNGVKLTGLNIRKENQSISPNIYLEQFYDQYQNGEEINHIIQTIFIHYNESMVYMDEKSDITFGFDENKDKIIYRLISSEWNNEILNDTPHIKFLNLAIVFYCLVHCKEDGIETVRITKDIMKQWEIDTKTLLSYARKNTEKLFPVVVKNLSDIVKNYLKDDPETQEEQKEQKEFENPRELLVLTNEQGINGATAILYENVLKHIADTYDSDLYVFPSSIHEVILTPYNEILKREELEKMVQSINETQVPKEDILSDSVYLYNRKTNSFA